jgi:hypothetical protein
LLQWPEYVANMEETREIFVGKPVGKKLFGIPIR